MVFRGAMTACGVGEWGGIILSWCGKCACTIEIAAASCTTQATSSHPFILSRCVTAPAPSEMPLLRLSILFAAARHMSRDVWISAHCAPCTHLFPHQMVNIHTSASAYLSTLLHTHPSLHVHTAIHRNPRSAATHTHLHVSLLS